MKMRRLAAAFGVGLLGAVLSLLIVGAAPALGAGTRYVATGGRDSLPGDVPNACTSTTDPCASVQHAVNVADEGDEVRVATGVYTHVRTTQGYTQSLYISRTVTVRGGYSADFGAWDSAPSATVLDAGEEGRVVLITGTAASPVRLEALQLLNGSTPDGGGGIYVVGTQVIVSGCEVVSATAENEGGGIFLRDSDGSTIADTAVVDTSGIINGCGGICVVGGERVTIDGVDVRGTQGSGVLVDNSSQVTISHSVIHESADVVSGLGAFQMGGIGITRTQEARILYNHVYSITALDAPGVSVIESDGAAIVGNLIHGNQGRVASGIYVGDSNDARLVNNVVWGNSNIKSISQLGVKGPGILIFAADGAGSGPPYHAYLLHNTILSNTGEKGQGVGVYVELEGASTVSLINNIIVRQTVGISVTKGNTVTLQATLWGAGVWANDKDSVGKGKVLTGTVNLWELPGFLDPASGNYRLSALSPAIDAGVNTDVVDDIDRDERPQGGGPDIGADEYLFPYRIGLPLVLRAA